MKNVIELLEKMGKNVSMLNAAKLEQAIADAGLTPELAAAVNAGDVDQVEMLLGKNGRIFCEIKEYDPAPKEQPAQDEPKKDEQKKEERAVNY